MYWGKVRLTGCHTVHYRFDMEKVELHVCVLGMGRDLLPLQAWVQENAV